MQDGEGVVECDQTKDDEDICDEEEDCFSIGLLVPCIIRRRQVSYSISSPFQRCHPSFVPDSITHVPLFNARVSTIQRYRVGRTMGIRVLERGNSIMN